MGLFEKLTTFFSRGEYDLDSAVSYIYERLSDAQKTHLTRSDVEIIIDAKDKYINEQATKSAGPPFIDMTLLASQLVTDFQQKGRVYSSEDILSIFNAEDGYLEQAGLLS